MRLSKTIVKSRVLRGAGDSLWAVLLGAIAVMFLIFSAAQTNPFLDVRSTLSDLAAPVIKTVYTPVERTITLVRDVSGLAHLQEQNIALRAENAKLKEWYLAASSLQAENESLKNLLNVKLPPQQKILTAHILADTSSAFAKSMMLTAGTQDGLKKGSPVVAPSGVAGRLIEVGDSTSRVILLTDMNARIPVVVNSGGRNIHAVLAGRNDKSPILLHLPEDVTLTEGAHIMTSGIAHIYPAGLPVARLVVGEDGNYLAEPYVDTKSMTHVRVLMPDEKNILNQ